MTHVRTLLSHSSKIFTALVAAALIFTWTTGAQADGTAANKLAAAGSTVEAMGPGDAVPVLEERMKVSSPRDLILQLSTECSILTALKTGGTNPDGSNMTEDHSYAFGEVLMYITVDGTRVPVAEGDEDGEVVFCNRAYERRVTDTEDDDDGLDENDDYIRTRTANAFNWLALDTGVVYDKPENGNNILDIIVWAEFTETSSGTEGCQAATTGLPGSVTGECAEALIGNRTLIIENTNAQNTEVVTPTDPETSTEDPESPECPIGLPVCGVTND